VFCSCCLLGCLSVYTYDSKFTGGVPLCRELHDHLITEYHSYAFSTFREGQRCGNITNKQTNKLPPCVIHACYMFMQCVFCSITLLCMRMISRVQGPLRECPRAGHFQATLLLRTTRICSQRLGGISSVVAYKQTNKQTRHCLSHFPGAGLLPSITIFSACPCCFACLLCICVV